METRQIWLVTFWRGGYLASVQLGHRDLTWTPTHFSYSSIHFNLMRVESKHGFQCQAELDCNPSFSKEVCVFIPHFFFHQNLSVLWLSRLLRRNESSV